MSATSLYDSIIQANGRVNPKTAHLSCGHDVPLNGEYYKFQKLFPHRGKYDVCLKCYADITIVSVSTEKVKETVQKTRQIAQPELIGALPVQPVDAETLYQTGVEKFKEENHEAAVELFTKAAEQGHSNAYYKLGICYYYEQGVPEIDPKTKKESLAIAFALFKKAANRGIAKAKFKVGYCYEYGIGVEQNDKKAFEWYKRGAKSGHVESMNFVAMCYRSGTGITPNEDKGISWLAKAADQGDLHAAEVCEEWIKEREAIIDENDATETEQMSIYEFFKSIDPNSTQNIIKKRNEYLRKFHGNQDEAIQAAIADNRKLFSVDTALCAIVDIGGKICLNADRAYFFSLFRQGSLDLYLKGWHETLLIAALNGYDLEDDSELFIKMSSCCIMAALFHGFIEVFTNSGVPGLKRESVKQQLQHFVKRIPLRLSSQPCLNYLLKCFVDQLIVEGGTALLTGFQPALTRAVNTAIIKAKLPLHPLGVKAVSWVATSVLTTTMRSLIDYLSCNYSNSYEHAIREFGRERRVIPEEEYAD